ncbi:MAG: antibiotic biosynthesis monooxygenase [Woeseiaceae bacterium]|nr:antibiotic biosynthesis monooxygenase [Woeseiaceae bacterium]
MIFVFEVHIKPGHSAGQYADAWVRASRLIQQAAGARGTRLHRKIGDPNVLLAIASWASKADRDAMEARPDEAVRRIVAEQAEHVDIRVVGEFEEPEWVVEPPESNAQSGDAAGENM